MAAVVTGRTLVGSGVGTSSKGLVRCVSKVLGVQPQQYYHHQHHKQQQQQQPQRLQQQQQQQKQQQQSTASLQQGTPATQANARAVSTAAAAAATVETSSAESLTQSTGHVKTIHDLNGPPAWPLLGNFVTYIKKENRGRLHEALADQHKRYGKMFKEKLGPNLQLHVADPFLFETIYRNEGKYPERPPIQSWKLYRRVTGKPPGILTSDGPTWHRVRRLLSKPVLPPKAASEYMEPIYDISTQMVDRLTHVRDKDGHRGLANKLPDELYRWALESVAAVALGTRMGCLQEDVPPRTQAFIDAALDMMTSSLYVMIGEKIHYKLNTRFWKKHKEAWDQILEICGEYITERLQDISKNIETGQPQHGNLLTNLIGKDMSDDEILCNMAEILLSGVDTTSNSLCFTLYLLSKHPRVQERLHEEVQQLFRGKAMTYTELNEMTYLRSVIKETQRLYPVATMNVRVLEDDLNLDGYMIPKKTLCVLNHFAVSKDPAVFDNPEEFLPERWLRENGNKYHPFAHLPFGHGVKGCVGRRVAMLELAFALAQISQRFKIKPHEGVELRPILRTLLTPGNTVPVELIDR